MPRASQKTVAIILPADGKPMELPLLFSERSNSRGPLFWLFLSLNCVVMDPSLINDYELMRKFRWIALIQ